MANFVLATFPLAVQFPIVCHSNPGPPIQIAMPIHMNPRCRRRARAGASLSSPKGQLAVEAMREHNASNQ
jgi:hypothetical protein